MEKKRWLVKSNGRILGPYSKDQVTDYLLRRELVLIDEISSPTGMWTLIRDQKDFSEIIKKLVIEDVNIGESTQVITAGSMTLTTTAELTAEESPSKVIEDQGDDEKKDLATEYVYEEKFSDKETFRVPLIVVSLLVVSALGLILYFKVLSLSEEKVEKYRTLLVEGGNLVHQGNFDKALIKYKEAYQLDSRVSDFHAYFGALLVRSGETVQARRVLEKLLRADPEAKDEVQLVLGLADLMDGDHEEAEKKFDEVLSPQLLQAKINKGLSLLQTGKYDEAYSLFMSLSSSWSENPLLFMLLAESRIHLWHEYGDKKYLTQSLIDLQEHILSASNYYQESLLIRAYLTFLIGDNKKADFLVKEMLSISPYQAISFKKDIFLDNSIMGWSLWGRWCQSVVDSVDELLVGQTLKAYCDFKNGSREQALKDIESVVEQNYGDPLSLSLYSFMLSELSDENQALVELDKALDSVSQYKLALSLKGHICEKVKDMSCVLESWSTLLQVDDNSLVGHAGLAKYYWFNGDTERSLQHYAKGVHLSDNYTPLLELFEKLDK